MKNNHPHKNMAFILVSVFVFLSLKTSAPVKAANHDFILYESLSKNNALPLEQDDSLDPISFFQPWQGYLGVITNFRPDYPGSANYEVKTLPYFDIRYKNQFFLNPQDGIGAYFFQNYQKNFRIRLSAAIAPGFSQRSRDDIDGLKPVGLATEARLIFDARYKAFDAKLSLAKDLGSGHNGRYADISVGFLGHIGNHSRLKFSLGTRIAGRDYLASLYDVSPAESMASGLMPYRTKAGCESLSLGFAYGIRLTEQWHLMMQSSLAHYVSNIKNSPIVQHDNALMITSGLRYHF